MDLSDNGLCAPPGESFVGVPPVGTLTYLRDVLDRAVAVFTAGWPVAVLFARPASARVRTPSAALSSLAGVGDRSAALAGDEPFAGFLRLHPFSTMPAKIDGAPSQRRYLVRSRETIGTLQTVDRMATAGTIVLEIKIAIDIVLAEDGKYYVDAVTMKSGETALEWTDGPFDTEVKARECLKWQVAVPVIEGL
jgi:hypothetical protein